MTANRKQFASTDELNQRLEESATIVASYGQEQPMTQQTIGNTVYHVGQVLTVDEMRDAPYGTQFEIEPPTAIYASQYLKFRITALPNPDPVAEDWREVELPDFRENQERIYSEFEALQLAVQEVCKADEVKLEWPERLPFDVVYLPNLEYALDTTKNFPTKYDVKEIMTCFLLGGRVSVKGGM